MYGYKSWEEVRSVIRLGRVVYEQETFCCNSSRQKTGVKSLP